MITAATFCSGFVRYGTWGGAFSEKMFSEEQLEQLRSFPEISADELIRYFTPTPADVAFVDPGRGRRSVDQLGMLVQLCTLPWLGFVPDDAASAPPAALSLYGHRAQTRSDHLAQVAKYLEWKTAPAGSQAMKELEQFLLDRAMEHDSPTLLFNLAREYLMAAKVIRPGALVLAKMVGTARKAASDLTSQLVGHLLTEEVRADLERMLAVDAGLGMTRLEWLVTPARDASATSVKTAIRTMHQAADAAPPQTKAARKVLSGHREHLALTHDEAATPRKADPAVPETLRALLVVVEAMVDVAEAALGNGLRTGVFGLRLVEQFALHHGVGPTLIHAPDRNHDP
ncbi:DUF4158 domain-containing protein [Microtetraspora malaysiensis]|uniref:DUF4158 domain-containing protein n=1 Tax=Microtetraspora malaysiensis TaxID=161358 RepID=A0ABW6T1N2_9ACTN